LIDRQELERQMAVLKVDVERHLLATASIAAFNRALLVNVQEQTSIEAQLKDVAQRISNNEWLLSQADAIRKDIAERDRLRDHVSNLRESLNALTLALETKRQEIEHATAHLLGALDASKALKDAREKAALLKTVPFGEKCGEAGCQFVSSAVKAQETIESLVEPASKVPDTETQLERLRNERDQLSKQQQALAKDIQAADSGLAQLKLLKHETELITAEAKMAEYQAQLRDLEDRHAKREKERAEIESERTAASEDAAGTTAAQQRADVLETEIAAVARRETNAAVQLARLDERRKELGRQLDAATRRETELNAHLAQRTAMDDEWLAWRTLAQALGRDGLPKLEIDAAGPTVSDITNQLLEVGYGTRFTVDLVTQVERADGKGLKEEFDLRVFDNINGGRRDLADLSGGERVVVEEALRAGILLFNNSRNQSFQIRTCWRDETTGALDPDNVPRYVAMLRRMHQLGGFVHTLFVTHSEAAAQLADTVIRVKDGVPVMERG
jgi:exonuclease SbcC